MLILSKKFKIEKKKKKNEKMFPLYSRINSERGVLEAVALSLLKALNVLNYNNLGVILLWRASRQEIKMGVENDEAGTAR